MTKENEILVGVWDVPPGKWTVKKKFVGTWRITELKEYDMEYLDLCGPAKVTITMRGSGRLNFGAIEAEIDGRMDEISEGVFRFSFEGQDEGDPFIGRGYCIVDGKQMTGRLFRHFGDEFSFRARKVKKDDDA
jgi:hypothetical protein